MARKPKEDTRNLFKRGKTWYVHLSRDGQRVIQTTKQTTIEKAREFRDSLLAPLRASNRVEALETLAARVDVAKAELVRIEAAQPALKLTDVWAAYLAASSRPDSGDRTLKEYETRWRRFAIWIDAQYPAATELRHVTAAMAEAYAHDLSDAKYSPSTYNLHRNLLRLVWRVVGEQARCHGNPWDRVSLRKLQAHASRRHALTAGQFTALLDAAERDTDLHDLFMVLAWTGQRLVDAVMLRWGEIDFARGVITLVPRKTARRLGKQVNVPLFPALRPVLDRRQAAQGGVVIPSAQVFPALVSEYLRDRGAALSKRIAAVFNRAGMESSEEREGRAREVCVYGAHSLRHHFVTAAIAAGLPGAMIKSITGHATDDMLEHYQHMGAAQASEFAKLIGAGSGGSVTDGDTKRREPLPAWARTAARKAAEALAAGNTTEATAALAALLS